MTLRNNRKTPVGLMLLAIPWLLAWNGDAPPEKSASTKQLTDFSAAEKLALQKNYDAFHKLPAEKQQRLRKIHRQIQADANSQRLLEVAQRYQQWLKKLPISTQAELASLPTDQKLRKFRQLAYDPFGAGVAPPPLTQPDREAFSQWLSEHFDRRYGEPKKLLDLGKDIPSFLRDRLRGRMENATPIAKAKLLKQTYLQYGWMVRHSELFRANPQEAAALSETLSPVSRRILEVSRAEKRDVDIIRHWWQDVVSNVSTASDEELWAFYNKIKAADRERFETMPSDRMLAELRRAYVYSQRSGSTDLEPFFWLQDFRNNFARGGRGPGGRGFGGPGGGGPGGRGGLRNRGPGGDGQNGPGGGGRGPGGGGRGPGGGQANPDERVPQRPGGRIRGRLNELQEGA